MSRCAEGQHRLTQWLVAFRQAAAIDSLESWADYRGALALYRIHNKSCVVCHERMLADQGPVVPHFVQSTALSAKHGEFVQEEIDMDLALEIARDKLYQTIRERT